MKNTWLKFLCTLLALCTLLSVAACQKTPPIAPPDNPSPDITDENGEDIPTGTTPEDQPSPDTDADKEQEDEPTVPEDPNKLTPNASYILVRSENSKMDEMTATQLVWRGLRSTYGGAFTMKTDFVP